MLTQRGVVLTMAEPSDRCRLAVITTTLLVTPTKKTGGVNGAQQQQICTPNLDALDSGPENHKHSSHLITSALLIVSF